MGRRPIFRGFLLLVFPGGYPLSTPNKPLINFQMGQDQEPELRVQKYSFFLSGNSGFLHVLWGCKANVKLEALCLGLKTRKFSHGLLWFVERQFFFTHLQLVFFWSPVSRFFRVTKTSLQLLDYTKHQVILDPNHWSWFFFVGRDIFLHELVLNMLVLSSIFDSGVLGSARHNAFLKYESLRSVWIYIESYFKDLWATLLKTTHTFLGYICWDQIKATF